MFDKCPGVSNITTPTIKIKNCPECGEEVEVVSTDMQTECPKCGFTIYNDILSCIEWCQYARECVGDEMYNRLKKTKDEK